MMFGIDAATSTMELLATEVMPRLGDLVVPEG